MFCVTTSCSVPHCNLKEYLSALKCQERIGPSVKLFRSFWRGKQPYQRPQQTTVEPTLAFWCLLRNILALIRGAEVVLYLLIEIVCVAGRFIYASSKVLVATGGVSSEKIPPARELGFLMPPNFIIYACLTGELNQRERCNSKHWVFARTLKKMYNENMSDTFCGQLFEGERSHHSWLARTWLYLSLARMSWNRAKYYLVPLPP